MQERKRGERRMKLEITDQERLLLLELVLAEQNRAIQGLDHTDSRDYKAILKERLAVLETLLSKCRRRAG